MANQHFGKIGDIWKHLPLATILSRLRPRFYWETHAGSATYELTHSWERDFGVFHFLDRAGAVKATRDSAYMGVLREFTGKTPPQCPGSPAIAMKLLGDSAKYLFCDIDGQSLQTIRDTAGGLGVTPEHLECIQADGVTTILQRSTTVEKGDLSKCFVHIDACAGDDPFGDSPARREAPAPIDAFCKLAERGFPCMFWYGLDGIQHRGECWDRMRKAIDAYLPEPSLADLWSAEIYLGIFESKDYAENPGVRGCGILLANVPASVLIDCEDLGAALEQVYQGAKLPGGADGSIRYASFAF